MLFQGLSVGRVQREMIKILIRRIEKKKSKILPRHPVQTHLRKNHYPPIPVRQIIVFILLQGPPVVGKIRRELANILEQEGIAHISQEYRIIIKVLLLPDHPAGTLQGATSRPSLGHVMMNQACTQCFILHCLSVPMIYQCIPRCIFYCMSKKSRPNLCDNFGLDFLEDIFPPAFYIMKDFAWSFSPKFHVQFSISITLYVRIFMKVHIA